MEISEAKIAKSTHLWLLFTEELKIFGFNSKHVLCHIGKFAVRKTILVEIMKFTYKFDNPQNANVTLSETGSVASIL